MRSSAQGVLSLTLMLNTLFRAGSGGNNGCTLFLFVGLIALANDVSTVVAEAFALGMVEGGCQKWL